MTYRSEIEHLTARLEPELRDAFRAAVQDWRDRVNYPELVDALEARDIDRAIRALNIEPAVFNEYVTTQTNIYSSAGWITSRYIPGEQGIVFRFDMSNPRAEARIREYGAQRVVGYTQEQIATAQRVIVEGYANGRGPKNIAVEIAGRVNPVNKRREGGIIGLSDPQARYVQSVRDAMERGDYRSLFVKDRETGALKPRYTRMDGRDLRTIKARINSGKSLTRAEKDRIVNRYSDRLVASRAEAVARTETAQAVMMARQESYKQALEKAGLPNDAVTKEWIHAGPHDKFARVQHLIMDGVSVKGLNSEFILPDGTRMQHTHDPAGGAKHSVNCRCDTRYKIDFAFNLG